MTSIRTCEDSPQAELTPLPVAGLIIAAWNLLDQACDLVQPVYITISDTQSIDLLFVPESSSTAAITRWAMRFGGVLTSEHRLTANGPQLWVDAQFDFYGVRVVAFAHIPAGAPGLVPDMTGDNHR